MKHVNFLKELSTLKVVFFVVCILIKWTLQCINLLMHNYMIDMVVHLYIMSMEYPRLVRPLFNTITKRRSQINLSNVENDLNKE